MGHNIWCILKKQGVDVWPGSTWTWTEVSEGGGYVHTVTNIQVPQKLGDSFTSQISDCQLIKGNVLHKTSYLV